MIPPVMFSHGVDRSDARIGPSAELWDQGVYSHFCDTRKSPLDTGNWSLGLSFLYHRFVDSISTAALIHAFLSVFGCPAFDLESCRLGELPAFDSEAALAALEEIGLGLVTPHLAFT